MTQPTLSEWLRRGRTKKPRKRLNPVSKKRGAALKEYAKRRKAFLEKHPYCQAWMTITSWMFEKDILLFVVSPNSPPPSVEIHHTKKPKCKYLNDESTWLAVSRWSHDWIEDHKSIARQIGLLS